MRNRNIILIIVGSALFIVALAFVGRWTMGLGGDSNDTAIQQSSSDSI